MTASIKQNKLKYTLFVIKWFLIGKNHCDLPEWSKKSLYLVHKLLWCFIGLSVTFTTYYILTYLF